MLTLYQQKIMIQKEYQEQVFSTFFDVMILRDFSLYIILSYPYYTLKIGNLLFIEQCLEFKLSISWHFRNVAENSLGWIFDYGQISTR